QDRVLLTDLRQSFRSSFPTGLDRPGIPLTGEEPIDGNGKVEEASAESFPASDPPSFASREAAPAPVPESRSAAGYAVDDGTYRPVAIEVDGHRASVRTGSVAIAAITSCTNTSNPTVMIGAGLLA